MLYFDRHIISYHIMRSTHILSDFEPELELSVASITDDSLASAEDP